MHGPKLFIGMEYDYSRKQIIVSSGYEGRGGPGVALTEKAGTATQRERNIPTGMRGPGERGRGGAGRGGRGAPAAHIPHIALPGTPHNKPPF